jgi:hypothetical protein
MIILTKNGIFYDSEEDEGGIYRQRIVLCNVNYNSYIAKSHMTNDENVCWGSNANVCSRALEVKLSIAHNCSLHTSIISISYTGRAAVVGGPVTPIATVVVAPLDG